MWRLTEFTEFCFLSFATALLTAIHFPYLCIATALDYFSAVIAGYFFGRHRILVIVYGGGDWGVNGCWGWTRLSARERTRIRVEDLRSLRDKPPHLQWTGRELNPHELKLTAP